MTVLMVRRHPAAWFVFRDVCPKCQVPYCSLLCYKNHGESCTEAFYQKKVNQVLALESKDRKDQTMSMLNRFHKKSENNNMEDDDEAVTEATQQEELWRLLEALENTNEDEEEANLEALLSPSMRERFRRTVESGELADLVLQPWHPCLGIPALASLPWHPWWMPDYYYNGLDDDNDQDVDGTGDPASSLLSLDERTKPSLRGTFPPVCAKQQKQHSNNKTKATNSKWIVSWSIAPAVPHVRATNEKNSNTQTNERTRLAPRTTTSTTMRQLPRVMPIMGWFFFFFLFLFVPLLEP